MCVYERDCGKTRDDQMYSAVFRNNVTFQHVVCCAAVIVLASENTSAFCLQLEVQTRVKKTLKLKFFTHFFAFAFCYSFICSASGQEQLVRRFQMSCTTDCFPLRATLAHVKGNKAFWLCLGQYVLY